MSEPLAAFARGLTAGLQPLRHDVLIMLEACDAHGDGVQPLTPAEARQMLETMQSRLEALVDVCAGAAHPAPDPKTMPHLRHERGSHYRGVDGTQYVAVEVNGVLTMVRSWALEIGVPLPSANDAH